MAKDYNKVLLEEEGVIEFSDKLYVLNEKKSVGTIVAPYPALKKLNITKDTELIVTIRKKGD